MKLKSFREEHGESYMQTITHKYYSNINNKLSWYVTTIRNDNAAGY